jgi:hypothetical protein
MSAVTRMLGMAGARGSDDTALSFIVSMPGGVRLMVLMAIVGMW